jgi:PAS domain S-box-containing protein
MTTRPDARGLFLLVSLIIIVSGLAVTVTLHVLGGGSLGLPSQALVWWLPLLGACLLIIALGWLLLQERGTKDDDVGTRLRGLLEAAPDAGIICRQDRTIALVNDQAAKLFGYKADQLRNLGIELLIPGWLRSSAVSPTDRSPSSTPSGSWRMGLGADLVGMRKDGVEIPIELSVSPLEAGGERFIVSFIRNITERKKLEERVRQAQKLEAVGRLAGGVAHDFNNMLTAIIGYSDLMVGSLPAGDPLRDGLEQIKKAGDRAAALTQQLLAFSRKQMLQPTVVDLNALIHETHKMLRRLIPEDIEFALQLDPCVRPVRADVAQTQQVLINLALNARDAMPQGGRLSIETGNTDLTESYARKHSDVRPGPYAVLTVTDTGCGMDEATQARVFEPFFTTKVQGKGTGLGLATVYGIVKQSGGHIELVSQHGRGSLFRVYLPTAEDAVPTLTIPHARTKTPTGTETVLLAEDDEALRSLARRVLEENGYQVLAARNGSEALQACRKHAGPVHILVSDVVMPSMNGPQLAQHVKSLHPDVRVVFMSGYTDSTIVSRGVKEGDAVFLAKPFKAETLARIVREVLDKPTVSG